MAVQLQHRKSCFHVGFYQCHVVLDPLPHRGHNSWWNLQHVHSDERSTVAVDLRADNTHRWQQTCCAVALASGNWMLHSRPQSTRYHQPEGVSEVSRNVLHSISFTIHKSVKFLVPDTCSSSSLMWNFSISAGLTEYILLMILPPPTLVYTPTRILECVCTKINHVILIS